MGSLLSSLSERVLFIVRAAVAGLLLTSPRVTTALSVVPHTHAINDIIMHRLSGALMVGLSLLQSTHMVYAGMISSSVSSSWTFGESGSMHMDSTFIWGDGLEKDVTKTVSLTLEEAHRGKHIDLVYDRTVLNPDCPMSKCTVCYGTGKVSAGFTDPLLGQLLTSPCPACAGRRYDTGKQCQPYVRKEVTQSIDIPSGVRLGYEERIDGAGNDIYEDLKLSTGNLILRVGEIVMPSLAFKLYDDRVEATVMMSVKDALKGFVWEQPYLDGQILRIDRTGKLTVPNSTIVMPHFGIHKQHVKSDIADSTSNSENATTKTVDEEVDGDGEVELLLKTLKTEVGDSSNPSSSSENIEGINAMNSSSFDQLKLDENRVDLIVKFELEEMKSADENAAAAERENEEINLDDLMNPDGTIQINSQEDLQRFMNAQNSRNDEISGRQLLYYLSRFSKLSEQLSKSN